MREGVRKFHGTFDIHSDRNGVKILVTVPATSSRRALLHAYQPLARFVWLFLAIIPQEITE
jgi:hypothetical protein